MKNTKRFGLVLTAILCAVAICAAMIPALPVFAAVEDAEWIEGVTATVNDDFHVDGYFLVDYLFDGDTAGLGWHATVNAQPTADAPIYITADLQGTYAVWGFAIYPIDFYNGVSVMPTTFELQLSNDGGATWETVKEATNVSSHVAGSGALEGLEEENNPLVYQLDEAFDATDFRMVIQAPGSFIDGSYYTAIGEIELWGVEIEVATETETETETETTPVVTETETETVAETVLESEVESADESDTETTVDTVEETAGETGVEETVAETVAETTAGTTAGTTAPAADEGCASVVGMGAVAVLAAVAAAFVLKKD